MQNKEAGFFSKGGMKISKVPVTPKEALASDLMGLLEKRRCQSFLEVIQNFDMKNPKTYDKIQLDKPAKLMFDKYGLEGNTIDFIGHAVALYTDERFLTLPAIDVIRKIQLYMDSMGRYGNSPFIYPIYGLGGIPEGFSRISAVNGGTFMLNTDIDEIIFEDGKVKAVKGSQGVAECSMVICDPSYAIKCGLKDRVRFVEKVVRCICILDHPLPGTEKIPSVQLIVPQKQLKRKNGNTSPNIRYLHHDGVIRALCEQKRYLHCYCEHHSRNK
jgi:Rab GDP dissociation inhibitor